MTTPRPMGKILQSLEAYLGNYSDNIAELIADFYDNAQIPDQIIYDHLLELAVSMPDFMGSTIEDVTRELGKLDLPLAQRVAKEIPTLEL